MSLALGEKERIEDHIKVPNSHERREEKKEKRGNGAHAASLVDLERFSADFIALLVQKDR